MKALIIDVYKNGSYKGFSNGGISEKHDVLFLIHESGFVDIDEDTLPLNRLHFRAIRRRFSYQGDIVNVRSTACLDMKKKDRLKPPNSHLVINCSGVLI